MLRNVSAILVGHIQGDRKFFLLCAACVSTYMVQTLHIFDIIHHIPMYTAFI